MRSLWTAALCTALLLGQLRADAQGSVPLSHQAWGTEEGLPDPSVHQVLQSRDGYLWLATEGGVVRFDGVSFKLFRRETEPVFASNDVGSLAEDAAGRLWFGTADGLLEYSAQSGWRRFSERDGLPSAEIEGVSGGNDGALLVLTTAGVSRLRGDRFELLAGAPADVLAIQAGPDGDVWLLTNAGMLRYAHGVLEPGQAAGDNVAVRGLASGPDGAVWTWTARTVSVTKEGLRRQLQAGRELPASRVTSLYVDREGLGWIGTNHGLFTLLPNDGAGVRPVEGLRGDAILSVMSDREGDVWVGTEAAGLHALRPRKFRSLAAAAGEAVTTAVTTGNGVGWFGTREDGVHQVQGDLRARSLSTELTSPVVLSLAPGSHGDVWVGTPDGLNHVLPGRVQRYASGNGLPDEFIRSVLVDAHGVVWAGTRRGLARIEGEKITTLTQADGLGSNSIGPLLERREGAARGLWVGTSAGLSHLHDGRLDSYATGLGGAAIVTAMAQDGDNALWIAVEGAGLMRFAAGHFEAIRMPTLPARIAGLAVDPQGFLWLRGPRAVYRVSQAALERCAGGKSECGVEIGAYNGMDGMPSDVLTAEGWPQIWQTAQGELWFATRKGIAVTDPAHLPFNRVPPPVVIERFTVDGTEEAPGAKEIVVGSGYGRYGFDFAALSYTLPAKNRYRYMLDGLDRDWIEAGTTRSATYTSLPPHRYTFRVQAQNNDGVWNEAGAAVSFRVLPPFYRRWWFLLLLLLAAGAVVAAVLRLRERSMQRRFGLVLQERNRMAREIHDTLAQDLVSISLQLDVASSLLEQRQLAEASAQLRGTRKLVKEGLEAARQSIWNLRANSAEDSLPARVTAVTRRYTSEPVRPRLKMGGAYRKLPHAVEDEVLRIAQESLSNVYRHAAATEVLVNLHYEPESLLLTVRDNGRGFSTEAVKSLEGHYGLRGMQERADTLHGQLTITSSPGEGTAVNLLVPLAENGRPA